MKVVTVVLSLVCIIGTLPQFGLQPLVWFALVPLLVAHNNHTNKILPKKEVLLVIFLYGLFTVSPLFNVSSVWWQSAFGENVDMLFYYALVFLLGIWVAIPYILTFLLYARIRTHHARDPFVFALVWSILEIVFIHIFPHGISWGSLGYALVDTIWLKHIAELLSVHGLTFLVVLTNVYIAELFILLCINGHTSTISQLKSYLSRPQAVVFVSLFFFLWVISIGFGYYREHTVSYGTQKIEALFVVDESRLAPPFESRYREYRRKIIDGLSMYPTTDIVLLPENALPFFVVNENDGELSSLQTISMGQRALLYEDLLSLTSMYPNTAFFIGMHTESQTGKRHNSLAYYQDGKLRQVKSKQVLALFYEYFPRFTGLRPFEEVSSGESGAPFKILGQQISVLISSEIAIPRLFTQKTNIILAPANEEIFVSPSFNSVQTVMARMRSIEYGAYVMRSGIGAETTAINPHGEIIASRADSQVLHAQIFLQ